MAARYTSALMLAAGIRAAFAVSIGAVSAGCSSPPHLAADLVVTHAAIWTGDPAQPAAQAVAVIGDRIVAVGTDAEIASWRSAETVVLDAEGRRLIPGFNDAHVRMVEGGRELDNVDLTDAATLAEFARRINERAKAKPGEWILGGRWDERRWTPAALPTRAAIDDVTNSSPVYVVRFDGQMALANAAALGRAGVTEATPDPPGGALIRDANGFPTGVLQGTAMDIVARVVPPITLPQRLRAVKRALEQAASFGVTSVQDAGATYEDIETFTDLGNRAELTTRVYAIVPEEGWYDQAKLGLRRAFGSSWLRVGAVRATFDGLEEPNLARTRLMAADHAGLQLSVGPGGGEPSPVLGLFEEIAAANGGRDRRFRLDASRPVSRGADRLARLNIVAVLQPPAIDRTVSALVDNGIHVALASGWPTGSLNPLVILDAAVSQGISTERALFAVTAGPAFAEFQEREKGILARGRLADMVILSDDLLTIPPARIKAVRVLTAIAGGKIVHQRKP